MALTAPDLSAYLAALRAAGLTTARLKTPDFELEATFGPPPPDESPVAGQFEVADLDDPDTATDDEMGDPRFYLERANFRPEAK